MTKLNFALVLVVAAMCLPVRQLYAQTARIEVNIPFQFMVDNKSMPAGEYTLASLTPNTVVIRPTSGRRSLLSLTATSGGGPKAVQPKLFFHKYGSEYFLSQVWLTYNAEGREYYVSSREIELARTVPQQKIVQLAKR